MDRLCTFQMEGLAKIALGLLKHTLDLRFVIANYVANHFIVFNEPGLSVVLIITTSFANTK